MPRGGIEGGTQEDNLRNMLHNHRPSMGIGRDARNNLYNPGIHTEQPT